MPDAGDSQQPTKSQLNHAHHVDRPYGNYHNYYFHRTQTVPDDRLAVLPRHVFESKRVLDLGCNAGKITFELVQHMGAMSAHGIDVDPYLIEQAVSNISNNANTNNTVTFEQADFMNDPNSFFSTLYSHKQIKCDTVLLLSITKWIHFQNGDEGLRNLFKAVWEYLPSGGALVVEPQEWDNYKKACKKNKSLKPIFKTLTMRPPFETELRQAKFTLSNVIERKEGGFSRPLMVWIKQIE